MGSGDAMKRLRLAVQLLFTIVTNGYMYGFLEGKIYQGSLKYACVPGLNCYSCPGAIAACPIGALQALLNQQGFQVPFAALGVFFLFGSLLGRFVCGWLCPFGLVQDLLHRIPIFKKKKRLPFHHILKYGKYMVLILLVCVGSMFLFGGYVKSPAFCKYLCPSGTLLGLCCCQLRFTGPFANTCAPLGRFTAGLTDSAWCRFIGNRSGACPVRPASGLARWTSPRRKSPAPRSAFGAGNAWMPARRSACIFVEKGYGKTYP